VEEGFTEAPAPPRRKRAAVEDDIETPRQAEHRSPGHSRPSSFVGVFVTLGSILLLTTIFGLVTAWWINSSVQSLQGRPVPSLQQPRAPIGER
jgi:hypothetical protein